MRVIPCIGNAGKSPAAGQGREREGLGWALGHGKRWNGCSVPFSRPKVCPEAPKQTKPPRPALRAPGNDPAGPPCSDTRSGSPLNLPRTKPVWGERVLGRGPGQGCLVGSVKTGSLCREPCRSRGRAGVKGQSSLPTSRPSAPPRLAPPALCSCVFLLPQTGLGTRGRNPGTIHGVFLSHIIYGHGICWIWDGHWTQTQLSQPPALFTENLPVIQAVGLDDH